MTPTELAHAVAESYATDLATDLATDVFAHYFAEDASWLDVGHVMSARYGRAAILEERRQWQSRHVIIDRTVRGPWVHGNRFVTELTWNIAAPTSANHRVIRETTIHTVADSRIVQVQSFAVEVTASFDRPVPLHDALAHRDAWSYRSHDPTVV